MWIWNWSCILISRIVMLTETIHWNKYIFCKSLRLHVQMDSFRNCYYCDDSFANAVGLNIFKFYALKRTKPTVFIRRPLGCIVKCLCELQDKRLFNIQFFFLGCRNFLTWASVPVVTWLLCKQLQLLLSSSFRNNCFHLSI